MWFKRRRCSFCRRSTKHVATLVAGARGYICDKCAYETIRIMEATPPSVAAGAGGDVTVPQRRASDGNRTWHFATASD